MASFNFIFVEVEDLGGCGNDVQVGTVVDGTVPTQ